MITTLHLAQVTWCKLLDTFNPCASYTPHAATGAIFLLGETGDDADNVIVATGGMFHLCNEII